MDWNDATQVKFAKLDADEKNFMRKTVQLVADKGRLTFAAFWSSYFVAFSGS
jgi:hypothetical protein